MKSCAAQLGKQIWHQLFGHPGRMRRIYFGAPDLFIEFDECYLENKEVVNG